MRIAVLVLLLVVAVLLWPTAVFSQTTTVTATIVDPNGNLYSNGTVSAQTLVPTGQAVVSTTPFTLTGLGAFSIVLPSPKTYTFTICGSPIVLGPRANPTPTQVCFVSPPILISGASQDVTSAVGTAAVLGPSLNSISGNAATATALLNSPTQCGAGNVATGITANGNANCGPPPAPGVSGNVQCNVGSGQLGSCPDITDIATLITLKGDSFMYGPNPSFDLRRFGGYASVAVPPATTGSITSGQAVLTVANAQDFANLQGIVVDQAGPATALTTPGQPTVTPVFVTNGATTYNYQVFAEDRNHALTAASTVGTTTTGAATLGSNIITLTNCTRVSGVATYTSSGNHNLVVGAQVNINGFGFADTCSGVKTVATVPTGTTFTTNDGVVPDTNNNGSGPSAQVFACNRLDFASNTYSGNNTIRYWVTRGGVVVGVAQGIDPYFMDCNLAAPTRPAYVPNSPPVATQPGRLVTTIVSGGGTTTLTLANNASQTVVGQTVLHDNSLPLKACAAAAVASPGGTCFVPNAGSNTYVFNATTDLTTLSALNAFRIHLANTITLNQPFIPRSNMELEGEAKNQTSFGYIPMVQILGTAYPMIFGSFTTASFHMKQLMVTALNSQQIGFLADAAPNNGGPTGIIVDDVFFLGDGSRNWPVVLKAGFDYRFKGGGVNNGSGGTSFGPTAGILFTGPSPAVISNAGTSQLPGIVTLEDMLLDGKALVFDCTPKDQNFFVSTYHITGILYETVTAPLMRVTCKGQGGNQQGFINEVYFNKVVLADQLAGSGTPVIDSQGSSLGNIIWQFGIGLGNQPLVIGSNSALFVQDANAVTQGNGQVLSIGGANLTTTNTISTTNSGYIGMVMPAGALPAAVVSAGGSVPTVTVGYAVQWQDANGVWSPFSKTAIVTPTGGNQTVTITPPTPPIGALFMQVGRTGGGGPNSQDFQFIANASSSCGNFVHPATQVVVDVTSFTCGTINNIGLPTSSSVGPSGVATYSLRQINGGFAVTNNFPTSITANRQHSVPDVTGYIPVTSYLNGAYDNGNRANGAIGANWVVTNNGINVAANVFVGTTTNQNAAYWNVSPFSPVQYSQMTINGLNGTTDFPGVTVLMSGSGGATHGYVCLMSTTAMDLKRINGAGQTSLTSTGIAGAAGDILRLEVDATGLLTCSKNGVAVLTATDVTYTSGQPGLFTIGTVATFDNWSGGNLHPLAHLDVEQDWPKLQHFTSGIALAGETVSSSPRPLSNVFLPGVLTAIWTGATWTTDKAITVTRMQVQVKTAPVTCTPNAIVRLTDGANPVNVTVAALANDSGAISQAYAAGAALTVAVQTAAAGCGTNPADANVVIQYRMQ